MTPLEQSLQELHSLYESMPETTCHKTSCASWCCTKLPSSKDDQGNFMPLPLAYGIEYQNILRFLRANHSEEEIKTNFDFSPKSRVCPFKDPRTFKCRIYPVRPFTCRVYGRKVPPVFFGVKVDPKTAEAVHCPDMSVNDAPKEAEFNKNYPSFWEKLSALSLQQSPFSNLQKEALKKISGLSDLVLLAFGEFYFLTKQKTSWFREQFKAYWEKMGNLL